MVFPKALPFARLTFGKSLTHGYTQSFVAVSQPWNNAPQPFQNRFQKLFSHHALAAYQKSAKDAAADNSFADYLREWQKIQKLGARHWRQYQFARRLEWQPRDDAEADEVAEADAKDLNGSGSRVPAQDYSDATRDEALATLDTLADRHESESDPILKSELQTSPESTYAGQLTKLAASKHYAEIPAVFEAMLHAGVRPMVQSYNALLAAAIHLPKDRHEAISKVLDVYSDMLQRHVLPDMTTYNTMVELLSIHALSVASMRAALDVKRARYGGMDESSRFLFKSTESEEKFLAEDDSLEVAIRLFDTAMSIHPKTAFSERAYRLLIAACAEHDRIPEMVTAYGHMDNFSITPRADTFIQMIPAFAKHSDMDNSIELYNEYKRLAISNNNGEMDMIRKDDDVYAALVKAYAVFGDDEGSLRFVEKLKDMSTGREYQAQKNEIGLKALVPAWLNGGSFEKALNHVKDHLTGDARDIGFAAVCIRAADHNNVAVAAEAFDSLSAKADVVEPAMALGAMHIRNGNLEAANQLSGLWANTATPEMVTMHATAMILSGNADYGLQLARASFRDMRSRLGNQAVYARINEAIEIIGQFVVNRAIYLQPQSSAELFSLMLENTGPLPVANHLLASLGPEQLMAMSLNDLQVVAHVQALMITSGAALDIASGPRMASMVDMLLQRGEPAPQTAEVIDKAVAVLNQPEIFTRWTGRHYAESMYSPVFGSYPAAPQAVPFEDSHDPYAATTDGKASIFITDILERQHGKFSVHLNEAMTKFHNIRRAGRHPRFFTYARLIAGAAKDGRLQLAQEVLAAAREDVPYVPNNRIVRHGWTGILDAMVAACLNTGNRQLADQFHQELLSMGSAPSANTFGLYITTLKESTRTFDEASEALKIFQRSKAEGVEPTSFLYNALIGKLGKARRIDDCLQHFGEMRALGIKPTSVTYGTIVNALCRVSDAKFAEELFDEMEAMPNYKPRPAPYHSMMQFFLTTKRDRAKVLAYHARMRAHGVAPTPHTHKLLIDAHATLEPVDMAAAEAQLAGMRAAGMAPEAVHYAALLHAKGCVGRDLAAARAVYDAAVAEGGAAVARQPCLYQALLEAAAANGKLAVVAPRTLADMQARGVQVTAYVANALIGGWAGEGRVDMARAAYEALPKARREPSTYEAMTRALVLAEKVDEACAVVAEACGRGYPAAVAGKISDLVGGRV
jgi:pentatricopeptide repeat protein